MHASTSSLKSQASRPFDSDCDSDSDSDCDPDADTDTEKFGRAPCGLAHLQEGWVIANHILVSFHVAFISSVLALPAAAVLKAEVLRFIFLSPETLVSAIFMYVSFHTGIALHELGHFFTAARLNALNAGVLETVQEKLSRPWPGRVAFVLGQFLRAPYGRALGIKREGLNYYPDAPYNLAVAAAGPRASRNVALVALPPAVALLAVGLAFDVTLAVYAGRLALGVGVVALLDFLLADPGKYRAYREREKKAREKAQAVGVTSGWFERAPVVKRRLLEGRMQEETHPRLGPVTAPWQFRNCGMGGRHTEKEYPESNVSMQEAMFLILGASDYQEAQEMTVRLQTRLKEIIEKAEGCRVMGIGLEGGLAPYIEKGRYPLPEVRLWAMMKQAILDCGFRPGEDVAIALDPAMAELEIAYRDEFNVPDSVGMYLFWRDKARRVLDRDAVLALYEQALTEYEIPILSIEDGFSEDDHEGWKKLLAALGDRIFVIGDDLVTTNDATIERAATQGLINAALIKANQIGSLYETLLAMLVALGKGLQLVVSHRSKSPNDDMEAHIALAANALGLKCGGGANTERLVKYQAVAELLGGGLAGDGAPVLDKDHGAVVHRLFGYEESTNAGVPTVGTTVEFLVRDAGVLLRFKGATPLGTSAGTGEAIHLVDALIEGTVHREVIQRHPELFRETEPGVFAFRRDVQEARVQQTRHDALKTLFSRAQRYGGKGCLTAAENVREFIAPAFVGRDAGRLTLKDVDRTLLALELDVARRRGKLAGDAPAAACLAVVQRKQNLGMNAMLSASLALARGVARLQGRELYELLREEMCAIIQRLGGRLGVAVEGSAWDDYVRALRTMAVRLEAEGRPLHQALREITALYPDGSDGAEYPDRAGRTGEVERPGVAATRSAAAETVSTACPGAGGADGAGEPGEVEPEAEVAHGSDACEAEQTLAAPVRASSPVAGESSKIEETGEVGDFSGDEQPRVDALDQALFQAFFPITAQDTARREALGTYWRIQGELGRRVRPFGLVNNRLLRTERGLLLPYLRGDTVIVRFAEAGVSHTIARRRVRPGTLFTDAWVTALAGRSGEAVDLEPALFAFCAARDAVPSITRIRDVAQALARINEATNRNEAVHALRGLVAHLSRLSYKAFLSAKNLQPEVRNLHAELDRFLNGPIARRLPLLVRVLVRAVAGLVVKPNLIDRLWNDTTELAEIHVRGSDVVNELRRSTHHALGRRTLRLARAYLRFLENGDAAPLARMGFPELAPADQEARRRRAPCERVQRIAEDLERFLGTTEITRRIQEWKEVYRIALLQCDFGKNVDQEVDEVVTNGIQPRNRWVYLHHLRILRKKVDDFTSTTRVGDAFRDTLEALLEQKPDQDGFPADEVESRLRDGVASFTAAVEAAYQDELFAAIQDALQAYERADHLDAFLRIHALRHMVHAAVEKGGFREQRQRLYQLDCLLEEAGYLAIRHVATDQEEHGVHLKPCFQILRATIANLEFDGVRSRELLDLAFMLADPYRTADQALNLLDGIRRSYHKILMRVLTPFETLKERFDLGDVELRQLLGAVQRSLFDLNAMVQFTELAAAHLREQTGGSEALSGSPAFDEGDPGEANDDFLARNLRSEVPSVFDVESHCFTTPTSRETGSFAENRGSYEGTQDTAAAVRDALDIIHISHVDVISERVRSPDAAANLRARFGGKGSGLLYISHLGLPTCDGFILPASVPASGLHRSTRPELAVALAEHTARLENDLARATGEPRRFGDATNPLLLAVRSSSVFSLPGILTTVVFVGFNDEVARTLAREDPWHAYDSYRRFLASFARAVWQVDLEAFGLVEATKQRYGVKTKDDLPWEGMQEVVQASKRVLEEKGRGRELEAMLAEPRQQLHAAVDAVFDSWDNETAERYRAIKGVSHGWHTAAIVQAMAHGNRTNAWPDNRIVETAASLTGVVSHTRMTEQGVRALQGEFKFSAAGDDLVAGVTASGSFLSIAELETCMPMLDRRLKHVVARLRRFFGTDQEVEFTVERGVLHVLQTRTAERRVDLDAPAFLEPGEADTQGIGVRGGAFRGLVAFDEEDREALERGKATRPAEADGVLMVVENPTPEEIPTILSADGLLTARGGSTSHAAVSINALDTRRFTAVMSATGLEVNPRRKEAVLRDAHGVVRHRLAPGDVVSIHGTTGDVYAGSRMLYVDPALSPLRGSAQDTRFFYPALSPLRGSAQDTRFFAEPKKRKAVLLRGRKSKEEEEEEK